MAVSAATARELLKNIPVDRKYGGLLEVFAAGEDGRVCMSDGKRRREMRVPVRGGAVDVRAVGRRVRELTAAASSSGGGEVGVVSLRALRELLTAVERIAADGTGETPVWVRVTERGEVVARTVVRRTGQRVGLYMRAYTDVEPLEAVSWERPPAGRKLLRRKGPPS